MTKSTDTDNRETDKLLELLGDSGGVQTPEEMEEALRRLQEENRRLKKASTGGKLSLKVGKKRNVSVYGLQRWPVTLYKQQWLTLLDYAEAIKQFIREHDDELDNSKDSASSNDSPSDTS